MGRASLAGCLVGLVLVAGSRAAAQPAEPTSEPAAVVVKDPAAARRWLATAQQRMQRGNQLAARNRMTEAALQFAGAADAYRRAILASDDVQLYVELAAAEDKLGRYDEAVRHLRLVLGARAGVRPEVARRAGELLSAVLPRVGLVTLHVEPPGAAITLGGIEIGTSPLPEPLVLMPGTYTLAFSAAGCHAQETELRVEPGTTREHAIELSAIEPAPPIREPEPAAEPAGEPTTAEPDPIAPAVAMPSARLSPPSRAPLYTGAAITSVAAISAGVLGALALRDHATYTGESTPAAERREARDRGQQLALATDVAIATSALAAAFTAYWYFYRYRPRSSVHAARRPVPGVHTAAMKSFSDAKVSAYPWVQAESGGIVLAGWF